MQQSETKWVGLIVRTLIAVLVSTAAARAAGGKWEPTIYAAAIAGLTTFEAGMAKLRT